MSGESRKNEGKESYGELRVMPQMRIEFYQRR